MPVLFDMYLKYFRFIFIDSTKYITACILHMIVEGKGGVLAQTTPQKSPKTPKTAKTPKGPPLPKNAFLPKNANLKKVGRQT